jgi:hypothetical protein
MKSMHSPEYPTVTLPSAERNLLFLLSREFLNDEQREAASELTSRQLDWERLTGLAFRKLSLPFVHDNLVTLSSFDAIPPAIRSRISDYRMVCVRQTLRGNAALHRFQESCLDDAGARHFYAKGPSLAAKYFEDPTRRMFRDVDVVVEGEAFRATIVRAMEEGFEAFGFADRSCPINSRPDIEAATKYLRSVVMIHPSDGIAIEVSKDLDKGIGLFPNALIFKDLASFDFQGRKLPTLSTEIHLCYVCYHSSRHTWSRLHWIADLDAIVRHESFSREKTRALAKDLGMLPLLDACLELNAAFASPKALEDLSATPRGAAELIELSVANLEGDLDLEKSLSNPHGPGGLPMPDLFDRRTKARLWLKSIDERIRPDFVQYYNYPLPRSLQWIYYISRPVRAVRRRLLGETRWIQPR